MPRARWSTRPGYELGKQMSRNNVAELGPDPIDLHVGLAIRARRVNLDMTQTDLGRALGITFQQVQKYEKGKNRVSASMLARAAEALECDVGEFFPNGPSKNASDPPIGTTKGGRELNQLYASLTIDQRALVLHLVREIAGTTDD